MKKRKKEQKKGLTREKKELVLSFFARHSLGRPQTEKKNALCVCYIELQDKQLKKCELGQEFSIITKTADFNYRKFHGEKKGNIRKNNASWLNVARRKMQKREELPN